MIAKSLTVAALLTLTVAPAWGFARGAADLAVTQANIGQTVCRLGYTHSILELPRFRGRCTAFALRDDWVPLFIADRRLVVQA